MGYRFRLHVHLSAFSAVHSLLLQAWAQGPGGTRRDAASPAPTLSQMTEMKKLKISGRKERFLNYRIDCAELFHDTFHYNVKEAKALADTIARGEELVVSIPPDCNAQRVLSSITGLGAVCTIVEV